MNNIRTITKLILIFGKSHNSVMLVLIFGMEVAPLKLMKIQCYLNLVHSTHPSPFGWQNCWKLLLCGTCVCGWPIKYLVVKGNRAELLYRHGSSKEHLKHIRHIVDFIKTTCMFKHLLESPVGSSFTYLIKSPEGWGSSLNITWFGLSHLSHWNNAVVGSEIWLLSWLCVIFSPLAKVPFWVINV